MNKNTFFHKSIYILIFIMLTGCTSMKPLDKGLTPEQIVALIKPGDEVIIHTLENEKHIIVVESITTETITGSDKSFDFKQIKEIKKEQFDGVETIRTIYAKNMMISAVVAGLMVITSLH